MREIKGFAVRTLIPPNRLTRLTSLLPRVLVLVGMLLIIDAAVLMIVGKWHLGTLLPLFIGTMLFAHGHFWQKLQPYLASHPRLKKLWKLCWWGFAAWLVSLAIFFYYIAQNAHTQLTQQPIRAMLVLGSGYKQGQPTPVLASRLDAAANLSKSQPEAWVILTGGIGLTEPTSEASVMGDYLVSQHHLPRSRLLLEEKSTSTELNISNSVPILASVNVTKSDSIAIVTSDFHTLRAKAIAHKQGFDNVVTVGSPTPLSTRYNNWLREYFAYLSGWLLNEF